LHRTSSPVRCQVRSPWVVGGEAASFYLPPPSGGCVSSVVPSWCWLLDPKGAHGIWPGASAPGTGVSFHAEPRRGDRNDVPTAPFPSPLRGSSLEKSLFRGTGGIFASLRADAPGQMPAAPSERAHTPKGIDREAGLKPGADWARVPRHVMATYYRMGWLAIMRAMYRFASSPWALKVWSFPPRHVLSVKLSSILVSGYPSADSTI